MYRVNVNNGTVIVVTTDCRANGMGLVRDGMYIYIYIYLFIYLFGV